MGQPLSFVINLCLSGMLLVAPAWAQSGGEWVIDTIAGGEIGDGGPAVSAQLFSPRGVAVDAAGNLYIADSDNNRIRRVDVSGTITTVAGTGTGGYNGDGGPAVSAQLFSPRGVAVDDAGNLYIADSDNNRIRRVDPSGTITTIAGSGQTGRYAGGYSGDGGLAVSARLNRPRGIAVDSAGNLFIADYANHCIRRVGVSGTITTVAGTGASGSYSGDGGLAIAAQLYEPSSVAVDSAGNLFIADSGNKRIRRVDRSGTITTIAGTGVWSYGGDGGPAVQARLSPPYGVAVDGAGNLYIADSNNDRIRRVDPSGTITTIAGTRSRGYSGDGGPAVQAWLSFPIGVAVDGAGNLYIADSNNHRIRRVDPSGTITTIAGTGTSGHSGDGGPAVSAQLFNPRGVAVDGAGNLYIADIRNHRIRRVDAFGTITTIAGTGREGYSGDNGPAVGAQLDFPAGVAVDGVGNFYIADSENARIRRVAPSGTITTIAGTGEWDFSGDGGPAVQAALSVPTGVTVDRAGNLYIADSRNHRIRRVDPSGTITTIAGTRSRGYSGDGGPAVQAWLSFPIGVAVDGAGNLYIADSENHRIRRVDASGIRTITTIVGTGSRGYSGDGGPAVSARLNRPRGIAVDSAGNFYIADSENHRIRRVDASGTITTIAGTGTSGYSGDGGPAVQAHLAVPSGVTVDAAGNLFVADGDNHRIRVLSRSSSPSTPQAPTHLEATPASSSRIDLTWRDNSTNETGFRVQRRLAGSADWVPIGTTATDANRFVDRGLSPDTLYRYRVQAFNATGPSAFSNETMARTPAPPTGGISSRLFVPVILTASGRNNSFFTSELTLTNRGNQTVTLRHTYTAAVGGGGGAASETLGAGRQKIVSNAIDYLRTLGIRIPGSGNRIGTLRVEVSGLDVGVTVRTTTRVADGRAGLAYPGIAVADGFEEAVYLCGLRQNAQDRSNVAFQNMGTSQEGNITLRTTVYSGDPFANPRSRVLPDVTLAPGGFHQYSGLLATAGIDQGYVRVERVRGRAPFYAYGVINDQANSDGSFVFPVTRSSLSEVRGLTLPVIIEHPNFSSELILTNLGTNKVINFDFVADAITEGNRAARFSLILPNGGQRIIPEIVEDLRRRGVAAIGPRGRTLAGAVFAEGNDLTGVVIGARTGSAGGGGQYSVFYNAVPYGQAFDRTAWIDALQQNRENRSNLALVNTGEVDQSDSVFSLEIYDGRTGRRVNTVTGIRVRARGWRQINGILGSYAPGTSQGYVRVRKTSGNNPFLAYGVVNDGGAPGQRSGDGAYVPAARDQRQGGR